MNQQNNELANADIVQCQNNSNNIIVQQNCFNSLYGHDDVHQRNPQVILTTGIFDVYKFTTQTLLFLSYYKINRPKCLYY